MTSLNNISSNGSQDRTVILNRIHELIDEIIRCDSMPESHDCLRKPVIDHPFYKKLQQSLSTYLSVCLPKQTHDEYLDVFWRAYQFIGIQNSDSDTKQLLSMPLVRSLIANIVEQVIERGLQGGVASC